MRRFVHFVHFILFMLSSGFVAVWVLLAALAWLVATPAGLSSLAQWAGNMSGERLKIEQVDGRLLDHFEMGRLHWQSADLDLDVRGLQLDWSPSMLAQGRVEIARLRVDSVRVRTPPSQGPTPLPDDLQWPFGLTARIGQWHLGQLQVDDHALAREISGQYVSDGRLHQVTSLRFQGGDVAVEGMATLAGQAPFALSGKLHLRGQLEARPLVVAISFNGVLARLNVNALATQGVVGQAQAVVTPWALMPYESLQVQLDALNPAAWYKDAPQARLSLAADIVPESGGLAGTFTVHNHQPGPVDQQRLPLAGLAGQLRWQAGQATFSALVATLSGGGRLRGQGTWRDRHLQLDLTAHQLDLEKIVSRLRPTRLSGSLAATLGAERQALRVALRDARYQMEADASLQGGHLKIPHLTLAAQEARLDLQGEMQIDAPRRFSATGQLQRFDPSRFAQVPAARLNADWQASGQLAPQPRVEARFTIHDSQIVQQPLKGQGTLSLVWPKIPKMEIALWAGSSRFQMTGAYGQPEDRLTLSVDAPHLDELRALGLEGGLVGQGMLVGDVRSPQLNLQLSAAQLGWRNRFRLAGLKLALNAGMSPTAPLNLDVSIASLDLPEYPALLQKFQLNGEGQWRAHRLRAQTGIDLAGQNHLTLAMDTGWNDTNHTWSGQLLEATLQAADRVNDVRNVRLLQPAPFSLSASQWQLGPVALSSAAVDGRIHLQGRADAQRMQLEIRADGSRMGQVNGELQAAMQGAWSLDKAARWQGGLHTDMPDLGWLAEWMGEGWASGGRLRGDLQLGGSPARPLASGRARGTDLSLRLPEQGLALARGALDVELRDNLLQIHRFGFDSVLQPPPRALRLVSDENLDRLTAQPGRLDIVGEMRLDEQGEAMGIGDAAHAWLDLRLDRVGAWQRADQWVLVSGSNRMGWKAGVLELRGLLTVDAGYWQLARMGVPRLSDDVHVRRAGAPPATGSFRPRLDLDVTADLGRHFLFEGAGLTSGLSGQVRLSALGRDLPRASGRIQARDGRFEAYGQKLDIERGILRFNGLLDNPGLDVMAIRKGLAIEPGVQIGGTVQKPVVKLISTPDLPETEKLAWLVLGHGSEQMGVGDATLLLSAAGDLFGNDAGNVVGQLRKTFGIDEIGIRQGSLGDNGSRAPTSRVAGGSVDAAAAGNGQQIFSIAKRLSSNILLSYEQAMGKAESLVKLTVNLGRQVSVIGRAGSDNAIDILYTLSFGKPTGSVASGKAGAREAACSGGVNCPE